MWKVNILTLFPEMFPGSLNYSIAGSALEKGIWGINTVNIRDFSDHKYKQVDDKIFGGGVGLLLKPDILEKAINYIYKPSENHMLIYLTPRGKLLNQKIVSDISLKKEITIICGRYEGIDERIINYYNPQEISIGDYILSGGEPAATVLIDACVRLLPEVIKYEASAFESFADQGEFAGLLEHPQYTRPATWNDLKVPEILLSGDHAKIKKWKLEMAKQYTKVRRPDLWKKYLDDNIPN